jgi:preprotein translocase subunit SecG
MMVMVMMVMVMVMVMVIVIVIVLILLGLGEGLDVGANWGRKHQRGVHLTAGHRQDWGTGTHLAGEPPLQSR